MYSNIPSKGNENVNLTIAGRMAKQLDPPEIKAEEWNNYKNPMSGMDRYGDERLKLAVFMRENVLNELGIPWTIENGTLLGAWRNGKFIPHDDDFDFALFIEKNAKSQLTDILENIKALLPPRYDARLVTSYTEKIEVFDPSYGKYICFGPDYAQYNYPDYHHVTMDVQPYERIGDVYRSLYKNFPRFIDVSCADLFPLGTISLEGELFPAPNNVEAVLTNLYGSLAPGAKYNRQLAKYIDP